MTRFMNVLYVRMEIVDFIAMRHELSYWICSTLIKPTIITETSLLSAIIKARYKAFIFIYSWPDSHAIMSAHITVAIVFIDSLNVIPYRNLSIEKRFFIL